MPAKAIMLQGTGSDVGKSVLVAALCRIARQRGFRVAPFKPQNMSNNAHACADGGEIGRAQAVQAQAAGVEASVHMNPVLLKPQSDQTAQVVVQGRVLDTLSAKTYMDGRSRLLPPVLESFNQLARDHELIIVEGAGSPAEVNLRQRDIANMGFAQAAGVPVCLIGDIDRGGVIAALAGTKAVLAADDARYITGFLINKFRGDISLFDDGIKTIEAHTQWPCWGVIPWLAAASRLPAEDAVPVEQGLQNHTGTTAEGRIKIVAPLISRVANFDDMDPLRLEPDVDFQFIGPGDPLPADAQVVVLLGTKSTVADLQFLRAQGWHHDLYAHVRRGGHVLGLCGGYQMLGAYIHDEHGFDGKPQTDIAGLSLLQVETHMLADKVVRPVNATCLTSNASVQAYEIHSGTTRGADTQRAMFHIIDSNNIDSNNRVQRAEGARSADGRIQGSYLHGLFREDSFRRQWLQQFDPNLNGHLQYGVAVEQAMDDLAEQVSQHVDVHALLEAAQPPGWQPG